jgi:hypothetical protein
MKIVKLVLVCIIAFSTNVDAQERELLIGTKIGVSYSTFSGFRDVDYLLSPAYGVFANIPVSKRFSLQVGYDNSYIGWYKSLPNNKFETAVIPVYTFPMLAKYYFVKGFNLQVGGELSILGSTMGTGVNSEYHRYNSGVLGGLGYDFKKIQIYARYNYGITNMNTARNVWVGTAEGSQFLDYTEMNRLFQIGIEFRVYKRKEKKPQRFGTYRRPQ